MLLRERDYCSWARCEVKLASRLKVRISQMKTHPYRMLAAMLAAIAAVVVASGVSPSTPASAASPASSSTTFAAEVPSEGIAISEPSSEGSLTLTWDPETFYFPKATGCTSYRFVLETSLSVPATSLELSINATPGLSNIMVFEGSFTPVPQNGTREIVMELCQPFIFDGSLEGWDGGRIGLGELIAAVRLQGGGFIEAIGYVSVKPIRDPSGQFSDVPASRPFAKEIEWLAGSGITQGFSDGTFRPLGTVNRDAMAAFLYRFAGRPAFTPPATSPFSDISPSTPFYKEITWLASTGVTGGFSDGTYRPQGTINRDAMAAFLYRFAGRPSFTPPSTSPFTDVSPSTPFYKEIMWLAQTEITGGFSDGSFRAIQPVNRDAMAAFLFRFDNKGLLPD